MRTTYRVTRTIAAAVPLAGLLGAAPALADPTVYYHVGSWHAFTDKDAQGTAVCGIGTQNPADGRKLSLTYTVGGTDLTLQADKPNWNIPEGTSLEVDMQIDQDQSWQAQGVGHGTNVQWVIGAASIREFDTEFRNGGALTVTFPSGNEQPWTLALNGSTMASATLWRCVQDLGDRAHVTSMGPNAPASSQPYGQAPTQPYAPQPGQTQEQTQVPAQGQAPANGTSAPTASPPASGTPAQTAAPPASTSPAPATKP
jgi:hypothetical protein